MRRVVVVGGGFCGLNATLELQEALRERPHVELVLVDAGGQFVFTPMLGRIAAGAAPPHRAVTSLRDLVDPKVVRVVQDRVERFDFEHQELQLTGGDEPLPWDSLAICIGAVPRPFPGHEDHPDAALAVYDFEGALALRRALTEHEGMRRLIVVGGGCIGVELAGTLGSAVASGRDPALTGLNITLVERDNRLLPSMHESMSAEAYRALTGLGVEVRLGARTVRIEPGRVHLTRHAPTDDGDDVGELEALEGDVIVWCGGVTAPPVLARSGLPVGEDGRVLVDSTLRVPELGEVYVGGDIALSGGSAESQRIDVAAQQARVIAANLMAGSIGRARREWVFQPLSEVVNLGGGRVAAVMRGVPLKGRLAAGVWHASLAMMAPSLSQRLTVAAEAGGALLDGAARWLAARRAARTAIDSREDS